MLGLQLGLYRNKKASAPPPPPPVPWTPSELTTKLWLDANDADSITAVAGAVSQWNDKSTVGTNHATQTGGDKPITGSHTLNDKNVIFFDNQDWMQSGSVGYWNFLHEAAGNTIFVVAKLINIATPGACILSTSYANGISYRFNNLGVPALTFGIYHYVNSVLIKGVYITGGGLIEGGDAGLITIQHGSSLANDYNFYNDGVNKFYDVDYGSTPANGVNSDVLKIGFDVATNQISQDIAELIICDSILSTEDRQKTEGYLAHKWGLAATLDSEHPYKSAAPTL